MGIMKLYTSFTLQRRWEVWCSKYLKWGDWESDREGKDECNVICRMWDCLLHMFMSNLAEQTQARSLTITSFSFLLKPHASLSLEKWGAQKLRKWGLGLFDWFERHWYIFFWEIPFLLKCYLSIMSSTYPGIKETIIDGEIFLLLSIFLHPPAEQREEIKSVSVSWQCPAVRRNI